ncbi:MAG: DUF6273 domain-containing protein [Eubacteriales bacterium]
MNLMKKYIAILVATFILVSITSGCTKKKSTEIIAIKSANIGDIVKYGKYEQDNIAANGKEIISWRVLAFENGKALLISEKIIDVMLYNEEYRTVTWETCNLRSWLNVTFFDSAFSATEKLSVATTKLINDDNPEYKTPGGNDTNDKVFLLSLYEADKYFTNDNARAATVTDFAKINGISFGKKNNYLGNGYWWLRSPGNNSLNAEIVYFDGYIGSYFYDVYNTYVGVRPAIWVNL